MVSDVTNNRSPTWLLVILISVIFISINTKYSISDNVIVSDGLGYYSHLRSVMIDRDLHYDNEFRDYNPTGSEIGLDKSKTATGHTANKHQVGPAILWLPFFLVAHFIALFSGLGIEANGYSSIYHLAIGFGSALYGIAGLVLIYHLLIKHFQKTAAIISVTAITLASNVIYYLAFEPTMSHAMSLFSVSLFLFYVHKLYRSINVRNFIILGSMAALMTLVRPQNILFMTALLPGLYIKIKNTQHSVIEGIKLSIALLLSFILVFSPQLIVWKIVYGGYIIDTYSGESFDFINPHILDSLFSFRHGLISWTPIVLLSLIGVLFSINKHRGIGIIALILFIQQLYINASWGAWWFGHSYGLRAYINCTPVFAFGLAMLISSLEKYKQYLYVLLIALVLWNIFLVGQYVTGLIPHGAPVTYEEMMSGNVMLVHEYIIKLFW